jgi:hypothetical protein
MTIKVLVVDDSALTPREWPKLMASIATLRLCSAV